MFRFFIDRLKTRLEQDLPGEDVQFSMAPMSRERISQLPKSEYHPKKSAVLILLFPVEESISVVLIQRPEYDGVHSGQVAFPGGKFDERDTDLRQTALREAFEEVGVIPEDIEVIGNLTDIYINPSNFLVTPFVGFCSRIPDFKADEREVKQIITTDLFKLNDTTIKGVKSISHSNGFKLKTPYYEIGGLTVWGATAMMISELNAVVAEAKLIS